MLSTNRGALIWKALVLLSPLVGCQHEPGPKPAMAEVEPPRPMPPPDRPRAGLPPPPPAAAPNPRDDAVRELNRSYDTLALADGLSRLPGMPIPGSQDILTKARLIYQGGLVNFQKGDYRTAAELARTAQDAARGLEHAARSRLLTTASLTPPPQESGNMDISRQAAMLTAQIADTRRRLSSQPGNAAPDAQLFVHGSRMLLTQADEAISSKRIVQSRELSLGADAFSRAVQHLYLAQNPSVAAAGTPPPGPSAMQPGGPGLAMPPPPVPAH